MKFELVDPTHLSRLISFEVENRHWFESFIEPRPDSFYHGNAIEQHLKQQIQGYLSETHYPGLVTNQYAIMARVNLKSLCLASKTAEVGFRVAQQYAAAGVASYGLKGLIEVAKNHYGLTLLKGFVLDNNPASARVLIKQGFKPVKVHQNYISFNSLSCSEYHLAL